MNWIVGVDGCRGGWVAVWLDVRKSTIVDYAINLHSNIKDILGDCRKPRIISVDMPIGLLAKRERGGRVCDREARKLLGSRASSIFSPPVRNQLSATKYGQVREQGLSRQSFHLLTKIREIDVLMTPRLQQRVYEAHPELAFTKMIGTPMKRNKKTQEGRRERVKAFRRTHLWPFSNLSQILVHMLKLFPRRILAPDDVVDAWALAWIAYRIYLHQGERVPVRPSTDDRGLRMEIWY